MSFGAGLRYTDTHVYFILPLLCYVITTSMKCKYYSLTPPTFTAMPVPCFCVSRYGFEIVLLQLLAALEVIEDGPLPYVWAGTLPPVSLIPLER